MTSSLKKLKDLERSLTVSIEKDLYQSKFNEKISNLKKNVKLDGFRKGKVPNDVIEQRYGGSVHAEVLNDLIQDSYPKEITEKKIRPANTPTISMVGIILIKALNTMLFLKFFQILSQKSVVGKLLKNIKLIFSMKISITLSRISWRGTVIGKKLREIQLKMTK